MNSVTLTYFDRKAFFLSIGKIASAILVLLLALLFGNKVLNRRLLVNQEDFDLNSKTTKFNDFHNSVQADYFGFMENTLKLNQNYPEILDQAADDFNLLDGQLTEIVGQFYRIQREIGDRPANL